ncbi:MAG: 30S ribosomal protein S16 [Candidatus Brocadiae bacterium]|nr:30S ribosomal protein S16 [Candidatus Brocadiia bacterium]
MVRLRLKKLGRTHLPVYRIAAFDSRCPRDGKALDEQLGCYDPAKADDQKVTLNRERIIHWLELGAKPSDAVCNILKKNGIYVDSRSRGAKTRARKRAKKKAQAAEA